MKSPILCSLFRRRLDWSLFPKLDPVDVVENISKGGGPGGQSVNKSSSAVRLKHLPTGVLVKVHETRSLERNRKIAWKRLAEAVDERINGEKSVGEQIRRLEAEKEAKRKEQRRKKREERLKKKEEEEGGQDETGEDPEAGGSDVERPK